MSSGADVGEIRRTLAAIASEAGLRDFAVAVNHVEAARDVELFPSELASLPGRHAGRLAEFRAGRACARKALAELGLGPVAIPRDPSGAPQWPAGVSGSIAHAKGVAAAIVARSAPAASLGLDLEDDAPLDDVGMAEVVCRKDELAKPPIDFRLAPLRYAKLAFVIKEATYKLFWPLNRVFLEFHAIRVSLDPAAAAFSAEIIDDGVQAQRPPSVGGRYAYAEGLCMALAHRYSP